LFIFIVSEHTSPLPCVDKIPNCNEYDADLCTNPLYRLFREDNCRKFCSLCTGMYKRIIIHYFSELVFLTFDDKFRNYSNLFSIVRDDGT